MNKMTQSQTDKMDQKKNYFSKVLIKISQQFAQYQIIQLVQNQTNQVQKKRSFCRFYLRGLCIFDEKNCPFSHGVHDLIYTQWHPQEVVQYDYLKQTDFCQKKAIKGPTIYKDLYEFQTKKIFTLGELNEDRSKRLIVRREMHKKLFHDFIKLLQEKHPQANFTEDFLIRQYTRAGFNKLMTRIKFSHLTTHLCAEDDSQYFQFSVIMPPMLKKQRNFAVKKAKTQEIDHFYKSAYHQIVKQHKEDTIDEGVVKKMLFSFIRPRINIPPLNVHLNNKKITFPIYLRSILGQDIADLQIKFQADLPTLVQNAKKFLQNELPNKIIEWNDVYKYLAKQHQINNGNVLNQVKPFLAMEGYRFLFFPMTQFIVHPKILSKIDYTSHEQCPCNFKQIYDQKDLSILSETLKNEALFTLEHKESYDIYNIQTLMQCAPSINNSCILGVDIEGRLRKNGYIEMIQLNNGANTFLIDIYQMDLNGDVQTFELTKKLLRNVFCNDKIIKIFHDCRHDSLALHEFMQCCIINVYDTSAAQTYRGQLDLYQKLDEVGFKKLDQNDEHYEKKRKQQESKAKQFISQANNVKTPGLNEVLKIYNAPHGINKNKELFHSMWSKGQTGLFDQRPLNPDFREYCIKDVLDLPHVYQEMTKENKHIAFEEDVAKWVSSQYVKYGYLATEEGEKK